MAPIIFAFGVVVGTILLIIFTEVLEKPILGEIKRIKYGSESSKVLPKGWIRSFHTTIALTSYLLGMGISYFALAVL
jgi:hypothetical protein